MPHTPRDNCLPILGPPLQTMPTVRAVIVWLWNTTSLALHFVDVILIFAVINVSGCPVCGWPVYLQCFGERGL